MCVEGGLGVPAPRARVYVWTSIDDCKPILLFTLVAARLGEHKLPPAACGVARRWGIAAVG